MAARRLLIVMLVLLGISILGGTLLPTQRNEDRTETTETLKETTVRDKVPRGKLLTQSLRVTPGRIYKIEIALGDQLLLTIRSPKPDQVEIPRLGLIETVDRYTPARFDILPVRTGDYSIRLLGADRRVGRIAVTRERPR